MSEAKKPEIGSINWRDLTVPNADELRLFYTQVVGWKSTPCAMGDYEDFNIHAPDSDKVVAGICHARGVNAKIPPQWLVYITVADVDASAAICVDLGGEVIDGPRDMGDWRFCIVRDPAGAIAGLIS